MPDHIVVRLRWNHYASLVVESIGFTAVCALVFGTIIENRVTEAVLVMGALLYFTHRATGRFRERTRSFPLYILHSPNFTAPPGARVIHGDDVDSILVRENTGRHATNDFPLAQIYLILKSPAQPLLIHQRAICHSNRVVTMATELANHTGMTLKVDLPKSSYRVKRE